MGNEAQSTPTSPAPPTQSGPSIAHRLALAVVVGVFSLGGEGCLRDAFNRHVISLWNLFEAVLFLLAPFLGAILGSSVIQAGGFFRPGFVGLMALAGLIAGMWLGDVNDLAPKLRDFLPHLFGAFVGALVGTLWTRAHPKQTTAAMNTVLLVVLILLALLLVPVLLRAQ